MKIIDPLPRPLESPAFVTIPTRDGVMLSARLWLPVLAPGERVPAIVDCHPYRVTDSSAIGNSRVYPYYAAHGYGCLRVDLRGSGNSEGILRDEYLAQEQDDGVDVINWCATQEWCTGAVGWTGISWGGFAALQVAARRPAALRAIITICSTDDRYADDVHYRGGSVLGSDMLSWASTMLMLNALPPDPAVLGDRWREMWIERLNENHPLIEPWLTHQLRDDYWKHGSVCEDFSAITAATLIVGGWADGYVDATLRLLDGLECPRKAIIGPWGHGSPHETGPGPNIGFLQESLRWWDHWLKGIDTGVTSDLDLRAWMQDSVAPATYYAKRPGRWLGLDCPLPTDPKILFLAEDALSEAFGDGQIFAHRGRQTDGLDAGAWCPSGSPGDWPGDQRTMDAASLGFTSTPLTDPLEIVGNPSVNLRTAADKANAEVVVRLCDVAPDGTSLLVSRGVLNLTHRNGHESSEPLIPGDFYNIRVSLKAVAHRFPAGHRIRLSVGSTYFPWLWPSPEPVELRLLCDAASSLALPSLPASEVLRSVTFAEPETARAMPFERLSQGALSRTLTRDLLSGAQTLAVAAEAPLVRLADDGIEFASGSTNTYNIDDHDPLSARVTNTNWATRRRGDWDIRIETHSEMTATPTHFIVDAAVTARDGGAVVSERAWHFELPRI